MKTQTYSFYNDTGHGWMKVKLVELETLGIMDKISRFSYIRKNHAYLEEDYDASIFIKALKSIGIEPKFKDIYAKKHSKIRSYDRFPKMSGI